MILPKESQATKMKQNTRRRKLGALYGRMDAQTKVLAESLTRNNELLNHILEISDIRGKSSNKLISTH